MQDIHANEMKLLILIVIRIHIPHTYIYNTDQYVLEFN